MTAVRKKGTFSVPLKLEQKRLQSCFCSGGSVSPFCCAPLSPPASFCLTDFQIWWFPFLIAWAFAAGLFLFHPAQGATEENTERSLMLSFLGAFLASGNGREDLVLSSNLFFFFLKAQF